MRIKSLALRDFRNYKQLDVNFADSFNVIYGNNAQGKTNIIEAIFLCASGRSHRTSRDDELIRNEALGFDVKLQLSKNESDEELHITFNKEDRKKIRVNEVPIRKLGDLMGHLNAVIFSPEDLLIIKQGPAERRRFIDITLSQLRPSYFYDLQQYAKILFQRNCLLKKIMVQKDIEDTLEIWNRHLVKTGSRIMRARINFINQIDTFAASRHEKLTNNDERLKLNYIPSFEFDYKSDDIDIEQEFNKMLSRCKSKEIMRGTTLLGPHRDDLDIILNEESTKIYGSQGQQRTAVLSMKLAEIDLMKEESGEYPVLLLDDVLSELDDRRKEYLLDSIRGVQAFITCTDKRIFNRNLADTKFLYIVNGSVVEALR